ncbi:hypothetical protein E2C01_060321 [Portunus trituberculatus]|uniref:Reverse transcriptase domain-containing protein n=1 Tax=Portunus trituberculatus TaxID=210409 RepID=A0A5B7H949_PORTR|nr:hypothetical protein [Portunus trituberculatus]
MLTSIKRRKATMIFMDLEKAFEMASAEAILETMTRRGMSGNLLAWTRDFLTHRKAKETFQGIMSKSRTFENGIPPMAAP